MALSDIVGKVMKGHLNMGGKLEFEFEKALIMVV